jgi:hydrogenase nickel incorporation protein HypA/HybF
MHELSLCGAIAQAVSEHADGRPVSRVLVRIGYLRQVVPDALTFSWEVLTAGTDLDGCELDVEHVPATVACRACDAVTTLTTPALACGSCASVDVTPLSGEEFSIVSLDVAEV